MEFLPACGWYLAPSTPSFNDIAQRLFCCSYSCKPYENEPLLCYSKHSLTVVFIVKLYGLFS